MVLRKRELRSFTLIELLVVIAIIIIMTAISIPAIKKFMDGQKLQQSGRIIQSAFNLARRDAITKRTRYYVVFFRQQDNNGRWQYGLRRYRERYGWDGDAAMLVKGVEIDQPQAGDPAPPAPPAGSTVRVRGLQVPIFDGLPPQDDATLFNGAKLRPNTTDSSLGWIEFNRDGTIRLTDPLNKNLPDPTQTVADVFDLNFTQATPLPDSSAALVDMNLKEDTGSDTDRRCFIDLDPNTGRVRFRVVNMGAGATIP